MAGEDGEMWVRLARRFPVWFEPEPLAVYRMDRPDSLTGAVQGSARMARDMLFGTEIVESYLSSYLDPNEQRRRSGRRARCIRDGRLKRRTTWRKPVDEEKLSRPAGLRGARPHRGPSSRPSSERSSSAPHRPCAGLRCRYNQAKSLPLRYIEMLGLPGAGKATLAELIGADVGVLNIPQWVHREHLRARPLRWHRVAMGLMPEGLKLRVLTGPTPDAKDAGAFALHHRSFRDAAVRAGGDELDRRQREIGVQLLFETWAEYAFAERVARSGDRVLFDEGLLQRTAFLMAVVIPRGGCVRELLETVPLPDAGIHLDLRLELAVDRVKMRNREFTMTDTMAAMRAQIDSILARLNSAGIPVTVVRAERPSAEGLFELRRFLLDPGTVTGPYRRRAARRI